MKSLFISLISLLVAVVSYGQIYKGTIGKITIFVNVMSVETNGELYGNYFYQSQGIDIPFEGTIKGSQMTFRAGSRFLEDRDKELFKLVKKGKTLTGEWSAKGKKLAVNLTEIDPLKTMNTYVSNPFFKEKHFEDIEFVRTSLATFTPLDSVTKLENGIQLKWYKEKHWKSYLFRVTAGLPDSTMKWLNQKLEIIQLQSFSNFGSCGSGEESGWETSVNDYFLNTDFCSFEIMDSYYCGGAHPDFGSTQYNFDLKRRSELKTEDLLQFPGTVKQTEDNFEDWSEYRTDFGERMTVYLKELYPAEFEAYDEEVEEGCNYGDPEVWKYSEIRITPEGFKIGAYFYRAARMCDDPEWSYVPYEKVKDFINPQYKKALLSIPKQ